MLPQGKTGVDKRIDVLSMAMMSELTIDELTEFEVYAPPTVIQKI